MSVRGCLCLKTVCHCRRCHSPGPLTICSPVPQTISHTQYSADIYPTWQPSACQTGHPWLHQPHLGPEEILGTGWCCPASQTTVSAGRHLASSEGKQHPVKWLEKRQADVTQLHKPVSAGRHLASSEEEKNTAEWLEERQDDVTQLHKPLMHCFGRSISI